MNDARFKIVGKPKSYANSGGIGSLLLSVEKKCSTAKKPAFQNKRLKRTDNEDEDVRKICIEGQF
jgi:hypothetical protein